MMQDARSAPNRERPTWHLRCLCLGLISTIGVIGCATLGGDPGQPLVPSRVETRTGPFTVFTNQPIAHDAPAIRSLNALEHDLEANLGLHAPTDGPTIEVYILKDREAFGHFLTFYYPELPPRRAFFLAQGPRRVVYTFYNDRLDEDLRHEATHALLHAAVGDLPLWLDEGLAEYFEGPDGRQGLNPEHLGRLPEDLKTGWRPDLARLETIKSVRELSPRDYRESWAWVHFMLKNPGEGKTALLGYLADLHANPQTAEPLAARLARLDRSDPRRMLAHLERVRFTPAVASSTAKADPTVLLQSAPIEPPVTTRGSQRRSLVGRFMAMIGLVD